MKSAAQTLHLFEKLREFYMFLSKPTCGDAEKKSNGDRQSTHCSCCRRTHFTEN